MHDIPSLFSQKTKKNTWNIFICRNLQHFSSRTYARAKQTNKQTNKRTNKRTKREIEKRRRTWQACSSAPPPSSTIAKQWMSIIVNSSKIKISSLVRRLSPRMEQAQQRAKQVDNRRQKRDLIQKMPLWGEINLKNVAYLTNNL